MHLLATDSPGENAKFEITTSGTGYQIRPKSVTSGSNKYFNPAGSAWDKYYGNGGSDNPAFDYIGLIGLYSGGGNSVWYTESTTLAAPTITVEDGVVTVADNNSLPVGYNVRYTTDGNAPTASSAILPVGGYVITEPGTFKAVIERYGIVLTAVASQDVEPSVLRPTFTKNGDGYYFFF